VAAGPAQCARPSPTIRAAIGASAAQFESRMPKIGALICGALILLSALFHPAVDHDDRVEREPSERDNEERRCLSYDQYVACPNEGGHDGDFAPSAERPRGWRSIHAITCSGSAAGSGRRQIAAARSRALMHSICGAVRGRAETTQQSTISREPQRALALNGAPYGTRTRVTAVKGRCPGPLDEGRIGGRGGAATYTFVAPPKQASMHCVDAALCRCSIVSDAGLRPVQFGRGLYGLRFSAGARTQAEGSRPPKELAASAPVAPAASMRLTTCPCSASTSRAPRAAAPRPSAAVRWTACRASGRTPSCRHGAGG
jgi:hypothetical protein